MFAQWDPLGYAPYAVSECSLAYVAPDGALWLRDLASGSERLLDASDEIPRRPTIAADVIAWEVLRDGKSRVRVFHDERTVTLAGNFDHAGEPRAAAGIVAFTAWSEADPLSDTDVLTYEPARESVAVVIAGSGQQRFSDVSAEYVAATDFSEDPRGYFDERGSLSDVVVLERRTGNLTRRAREGKQAFPLLGSDGALAYLEWGSVHPEPKFSQFLLRLGRVQAAPADDVSIRALRTDPSYLRPSLRDGLIDFVDISNGAAVLYRVSVAAPETLLPAPLDGKPFGPVTASAFTLIGTQRDAVAELRVVAR